MLFGKSGNIPDDNIDLDKRFNVWLLDQDKQRNTKRHFPAFITKRRP